MLYAQIGQPHPSANQTAPDSQTGRGVLLSARQRQTHLKTVKHFNDPLVVRLDEDVPLGADMGHLLLLQHVRLAEDLHGVHVSRVLLLHEAHLSKGAAPDHLEGLKVLDAEARPLQPQELRLLLRVLKPLLVLLRFRQTLIFQRFLQLCQPADNKQPSLTVHKISDKGTT